MRTQLVNRAILGHTLGHFTLDGYANLLPMIFPVLVPILGLSYGQVGLVATAYTLSFSLPQPLLGHLADRFGSRWLGPVSLALMVVFMCLTALAWSYAVLVVLVVLAGLASGTFHPQAARGAALASGDRRSTGLSIYIVGGNVGYSLGPLVGAAVFAGLGRPGTVALIPFGLAVAGALFYLLRHEEEPARAVVHRPEVDTGRAVGYLVLVGVGAVTVVRAWVEMGIVVYLPLLLTGEGHTAAAASQVLFVFLIASSAGAFLGGMAADRVGPRLTIFASHLALAPAMFLFLYVGGTSSLALAALAGSLYATSMPVTLSLAQRFAPRNMGVASGAVIGLGSVAGGAGAWLMGTMGDALGLRAALNVLLFLPLVAVAFSLAFPPRRREPTPVPSVRASEDFP